MRTLIFIVLALLTTPAFAQGWGHYDNDRYGYGLDIPPDYVGQGESDNGDGQAFELSGGAQRLTVWGGLLGVTNETFDDEVKWRMQQDESEAWNLTYQATTPEWASYSAIEGSRMLYQRMILLCDRDSYAVFRAEYFQRDAANMKPVIEQLVYSLRGAC